MRLLIVETSPAASLPSLQHCCLPAALTSCVEPGAGVECTLSTALHCPPVSALALHCPPWVPRSVQAVAGVVYNQTIPSILLKYPERFNVSHISKNISIFYKAREGGGGGQLSSQYYISQNDEVTTLPV